MNVSVLPEDDAPSLAYGPLGLIGMRGCEDLLGRVDYYITAWRTTDMNRDQLTLSGAEAPPSAGQFTIQASCPRFNTGEAKGLVTQSVRGLDLYILVDAFNYGITYTMYNMTVPMSPDDHFADLKRVIAAAGGKARRISVIMPMLYEGRQHKRYARESLDCALALQELSNMGVENIITFDAHDSRVQNSVPLKGFENIRPTYQMIKALIRRIPDLKINRDELMIVAPDEGSMSRCIFYSSVLGVDLGMFYKLRDYTRMVNARNPIIRHEFLGDNIAGKDIIVIDDMISSGDSVLSIAQILKSQGARRIFVFATFGLFSDGLARFDEAYQKEYFDCIFTTNLIYRTDELKTRPWYCQVDMSKYIAYIIDTLNYDRSISDLLDPTERIHRLMRRRAL